VAIVSIGLIGGEALAFRVAGFLAAFWVLLVCDDEMHKLNKLKHITLGLACLVFHLFARMWLHLILNFFILSIRKYI
jgi:hypothetical protein